METPTFLVRGYEDDEEAINREIQKAGIMVTVTSEELSSRETMEAYSKRDCVEKAFQALKSHLGMDKIGVTTEEAMHGKGLVWFIASILHSILFSQTARLRVSDRKNFTTPEIISQLDAIKADRNFSLGKRQRRYKLSHRQLEILGCFGLSESDIDSRIAYVAD